MGLNDSYSSIRGQILLIDPPPSINRVFSLVVQEERQRDVASFSSQSVENSVLFTRNQETQSHSSTVGNRSTGKYFNQKKDRPLCSRCGFIGHTVDKCYKLHGYPPSYKPRVKSSAGSAHQVSSKMTPSLPITLEQCQQLLALLPTPASMVPHDLNADVASHSMVNMVGILSDSSSHNNSFVTSPSCKWIVDTGATNHMVSSVSMLTSITSFHKSSVRLPNNQIAVVTHTCTVRLSPLILLTDVFVVPAFPFNLISSSSLIKQLPCFLILLGQYLFIQDLRTWTPIGLAKESRGLYFLCSNFSAVSQASCNSVASNNSAALWHCRLGHPSFSRISLFQPYISDLHISNSSFCNICPMTKQNKLPFPVSITKTTLPFELVHCDLWGPFSVPDHNGVRFFLIVVDDFTRCT